MATLSLSPEVRIFAASTPAWVGTTSIGDGRGLGPAWDASVTVFLEMPGNGGDEWSHLLHSSF